MWGYAEGNATVVGIVAAIIGIAALAYVVRRLWRRGR
jgi:biopolymer transport protein ExbB/TolQ